MFRVAGRMAGNGMLIGCATKIPYRAYAEFRVGLRGPKTESPEAVVATGRASQDAAVRVVILRRWASAVRRLTSESWWSSSC